MTSGRIPKRARVVRAKRDFSHGWGARGFQAMLRSGRGSQGLRWGWKQKEGPEAGESETQNRSGGSPASQEATACLLGAISVFGVQQIDA